MDLIEAAIDELTFEIELLGTPKTDSVAWYKQQALSLGKSFLLTAVAKEMTTPEMIDLLRKRARTVIVKDTEYNPEPPPPPEQPPEGFSL